MLQPVPDCTDLIPDPALVHRRLGEAVRAERLLRRLLRLSLAARDERARRSSETAKQEELPCNR